MGSVSSDTLPSGDLNKMKTVSARTIKAKKLTLADEVREQVLHERQRPVQTFKTLPEQVAKSTVFFKNFYPAELREKYKFADRMKRIDLVFPYAKLTEDAAPCVLLVDTPETDQDVEICYQKQRILKELGYKYCVIEKDANLFEVLQQLGVV